MRGRADVAAAQSGFSVIRVNRAGAGWDMGWPTA